MIDKIKNIIETILDYVIMIFLFIVVFSIAAFAILNQLGFRFIIHL